MSLPHPEELYHHPEEAIQAEGSVSLGPVRTQIAAFFKAFADPTRVGIIEALLETELCVDDLARLLGLTQSAVSHQLRVLRNLRVVKWRREGKEVFYSLHDAHPKDAFLPGRMHIKHNEEEQLLNQKG